LEERIGVQNCSSGLDAQTRQEIGSRRHAGE
jgi:hypothetical protein